MLLCTFCSKEGGKDGFRKVDDPNVIQFLWKELSNFDKSFDPVEFNVNPLTILLCMDCERLFNDLSRVHKDLEMVKKRLEMVLPPIHDKITSSRRITVNSNKEQQKNVAEKQANNCELVWTGILMWPDVGKQTSKKVLEAEQNLNEGTPKNSDLIVEEVGDNLIKNYDVESEIMDTFVEEVEIPYIHVSPQQIIDGQNTTTLIKEEKHTDKIKLERSRLIYSCELCTKKKTFREPLHLRMHIQVDHKTAPMIYSCSEPNCNKQFPVEILSLQHSQFHADEEICKYGCEECDKRFKTKQAWNNHQEWHKLGTTEVKLGCRFCAYGTHFLKNIRNHEVTKHSDKLNHSCEKCDEKYFSDSILQTHIRTHEESEGPFVCSICEATCSSGSELQDHLIKCHVPKEQLPKKTPETTTTTTDLVCKICGKYYDRPGLLKKHVQLTHFKKSYECELCPGKKFRSYSAVKDHVLKQHEIEGEMEKEFACSQCRKKYRTNFMLQKHIRNHKLDKNKPLACDICDSRFKIDDQIGLAQHVKTQHVAAGSSSSKNHHCVVTNCDKSFPSPVFLRQHERKHHPELFIYNCKLCDKVYSFEAFLETHLKTHLDSLDSDLGVFGCTVCKSKYSTASALASHLLRHTGETKHECTKCDRKFEIPSGLKEHMVRAHGARKKLKCDVCSKRFTKNYELQLHKEIHQDPAISTPKTCNTCGLVCASRRLLHNHRTSQHGKRRVSKICDICGKSCMDLESHLKIHTGDKKHCCYFCDRRFIQGTSLRFHLYTHLLEKPCICEICKAEFTQKHCLKGHMRRVHGEGQQEKQIKPRKPSTQFVTNVRVDDIQPQTSYTYNYNYNTNSNMNNIPQQMYQWYSHQPLPVNNNNNNHPVQVIPGFGQQVVNSNYNVRSLDFDALME